MNLLIVNEGTDFSIEQYKKTIAGSISIQILQFTPRQYEDELFKNLKSQFPQKRIEILNKDDFVDFDSLQKKFVETVKTFGDKHSIDGKPLRDLLIFENLNLWWCSGFIESTILKWNLFFNFYYLSVIDKIVSRGSQILNTRKDSSFIEDLNLLAQDKGCTIIEASKVSHESTIREWFKWFFNLFCSVFLKFWFKFNVDNKGDSKNKNVFVSYYPDQTCIRDEKAVSKVYGDLPMKLDQHPIYLTMFSSREVFNLKKLKSDLKEFKRNSFEILPAISVISWNELFKMYFTPAWATMLHRVLSKKNIVQDFQINNIRLTTTFMETFKKSLTGQLPKENLLLYKACSKLSQEKIYAFYTFVEFHSWETAVAQAAIDNKSKTIAIQQSAPEPTLTSYYFLESMFYNKNNYPLPSLLLCAGKKYSDDFTSWVTNTEILFKSDYIGHLTANYNISKTDSEKADRKKQEKIPRDAKVCFVPCSLEYDLCYGTIKLISSVADKVKDVHFLIKPHPNTKIQSILQETKILERNNVSFSETIVPELLPISDYCISTCTSVSLEAMVLGIYQVHLDISGMPRRDSLHYGKNIIKDVYRSEDLIHFLKNPDQYVLKNCSRIDFMGDENLQPYEEAVKKINSYF